MQSKRVKLLILLLVISLGYSWLSLFVFESDVPDNFSINESKEANSQTDGSMRDSGQDKVGSRIASETTSRPLDNTSNTPIVKHVNSLPETFLLLGAKPRSEDDDAKALIEFKGQLLEYEEGDWLVDTAMQLKQVNVNSIDIEYEEKEFTIALTPPNLLAPDYRKPDKTRAALLEMTPKQIGSRPRILEHLIVLTPTPYIADGKIVHPGLNPALFKNAGFQEDDVLKTINGKSVTIEHELEEIKNELKTAQTLTFTVMRKGRMITLYLDIPSEGLTLSVN